MHTASYAQGVARLLLSVVLLLLPLTLRCIGRHVFVLWWFVLGPHFVALAFNEFSLSGEILLTRIPFPVVYKCVFFLQRFFDCLDSHLIWKGLFQTLIATESTPVSFLALNTRLDMIVDSWRNGWQLIVLDIDRPRRLLNISV